MAKKGNYDLIVGVGGGSSMDIASLTSIMLTNPGTVYDYFGVNLVRSIRESQPSSFPRRRGQELKQLRMPS